MIPEKTWIRVCYRDDIPLREGRVVRVAGREIAVFNLGNRFLAIQGKCPHRGGPLADGIVSATVVVCPLHAWKFSLESGKGVSSTSQTSCIETFPVRVEHEAVLVQLFAEAGDREHISPACLPDPQEGEWRGPGSVPGVDEI